MIIHAPQTTLSYGTDAVAQSLRPMLDSRSVDAPRASRAPETAPAGRGELDLARLYPSLYAAPVTEALPIRAIRGLAFRLSIIGSMALMIGLLHH